MISATWRTLKDVVLSFIDDEALTRGAAIAFYTATSIAPILLIVIAIAGLVFGQEAAQNAITSQFSDLMGHQTAEVLQSAIASAAEKSSGIIATIIGVAVLIATASGVFGEMQAALNAIWKANPQTTTVSRLIRARAVSLGLVGALGFLLIVSLVISAGLTAFGDYLDTVLPMGKCSRDAFAARARLAEIAERSLDVQYYIWEKDMTGTLLFEALHAAADRGVRVRLLLDDNNTSGLDPVLAALDSHPNIEVRLFNPFVIRKPRIGYLTDFFRANRRMHNKSFTADNQVTIIGGRNIGDEYFGAAEGSLFVDLDVMAVGPIVHEVSNDFDRYWACASSYPLDRIVRPVDPAKLAEVKSAAAARGTRPCRTGLHHRDPRFSFRSRSSGEAPRFRMGHHAHD